MIINKSLKQHIALGLGGLLSFLLVITFFYAVWQWRQDWRLAHNDMPQPPIIDSTDSTLSLIAAIPESHLFGKSLESGNVPISSLQLLVTGIVKAANDQKEMSKAYISMAGQRSKIYQVGDNLSSGVKIYEITQNEVIVENDNHLEKLPLPREKLQFKTRSSEELL